MGPKRLDDKCDATVTSDDSKQEQQPLVVVQTVAHSLIVESAHQRMSLPDAETTLLVEGTGRRLITQHSRCPANP
jgi:hypothetical protein